MDCIHTYHVFSSSVSLPSGSSPEQLVKCEYFLARCDNNFSQRKANNNPAGCLLLASLRSKFLPIQGVWSVGSRTSQDAWIINRITRHIMTMLLFIHQQNVRWFGSHNWTTEQPWTAPLILLDAPRCSQIGWMPSDVLSGAPRLLHRCT